MSMRIPRILVEIAYEEAARDYLRSLPLEHFMESTPQATQGKITLESLDLVQAQRSDVHVFNELLVQYPLPRRKKPGQVVPDNMVVVHPKRIKAKGSYDVPLQPARPFWVLEYVSASNARKDHVENRAKYEHELKVLYYLLYTPDSQVLTLYRHTGTRYVRVKPNAEGRFEIAELELVEATAGLRPGTPDGLPILGTTRTPGYFVAAGHFRDGILLAPVTAKIMGAIVTGQVPPFELAGFSPARSSLR